jgi:PE family
MSFVTAVPELVSAATDLAGIGSTLNAANVVAAPPTTALLPAAEDEVSGAIAALLSGRAEAYQAVSAQMAGFHDQFVRALTGGAARYTLAEAANASPLQAAEQQLLNAINAPLQTFTGRPLIGNGANGAPGTGAPGAPGGWLQGDGGAGGSGAAGSGQSGGAGAATVVIGDGSDGGNGGTGGTAGNAGAGDLLPGLNGIDGFTELGGDLRRAIPGRRPTPQRSTSTNVRRDGRPSSLLMKLQRTTARRREGAEKRSLRDRMAPAQHGH